MTIRAAVFRAVGQPFSIESVTLAPPQAGEVLVQMKAAGVCHSDWHLVTGATPVPTPMVPGHEGAGIVTAVGEGVTSVTVGQTVALNWAPSCGSCYYCLRELPCLCEAYLKEKWAGTLLDGTTRLSQNGQPLYHFTATACFAEYTVLPECCCVPLPSTVPFAVAALIGCAVTTGVGAVLNKAKLPAGSTVAVLGCGGVGLSVVLGAALAGAERIIAVDTNTEKLALAQSLGATHGVIADDTLPSALRALTDGRGVDFAFECVGIPRLQEQGFEALRRGGTLILAGLTGTETTTNLPGAAWTRQEKTVAGTYYGTAVPRRDFPLYAQLFAAGKLPLDRLIARTWSLDELNAAYAEMLTGTSGRGVIVF